MVEVEACKWEPVPGRAGTWKTIADGFVIHVTNPPHRSGPPKNWNEMEYCGHNGMAIADVQRFVPDEMDKALGLKPRIGKVDAGGEWSFVVSRTENGHNEEYEHEKADTYDKIPEWVFGHLDDITYESNGWLEVYFDQSGDSLDPCSDLDQAIDLLIACYDDADD